MFQGIRLDVVTHTVCRGGLDQCVINGAHIVIYTKDPEADRAFFRDVLKFPSVDAGHGWLIFAMPLLETAFHDSEKNDQHELYLMCEDIAATLKASFVSGQVSLLIRSASCTVLYIALSLASFSTTMVGRSSG